MASSRRPTPAVYRRRRLVVLLGLILVLALIGVGVWLLVAQRWANAADSGTDASTRPTPAVSANPSGGPSAEPEAEDVAAEGEDAGDAEHPSSVEPSTESSAQPEGPAVPEACGPADVAVEAVTDKDAYAAGETPQLGIRLTNRSASDCTLDVGTATQVLTVSSGSDTWWRSTDCQTEPSSMIVTLTPGQVVESAQPVPWDRTRSSVSSCEGDRPRASGGGASYHLAVSIGGIQGQGTKQFLLY